MKRLAFVVAALGGLWLGASSSQAYARPFVRPYVRAPFYGPRVVVAPRVYGPRVYGPRVYGPGFYAAPYRGFGPGWYGPRVGIGIY